MSGYFDHNATTPLDPRVLEAMLPWLTDKHGNPSSAHTYGREASSAVEEAREQVAYLIGAQARDVVFCASGSEANNAVISTHAGDEDCIAVCTFEHPSVLRSVELAESCGVPVEWIKPQSDGRCSAETWRQAMSERTTLAVLMLANNEVGSLQPVAEVAALASEQGAATLTDAVQAVGKIEVDVQDLGVDYLVLGGHKFHGPVGSAAVWIRPGARWRPFLRGGSQEGGRRASTVNVPAAVGLGAACSLAGQELNQRAATMRELRDRFEAQLAEIGGVEVHAASVERLPNTCSVAFEGIDAQALMIRLDLQGYAVSMGSACGSGKVEPSATMRAMGVAPEVAGSTLRFSFAATNTRQEVDDLSALLRSEIAALREGARAV